jgi:hypothetical protein
MALTPKTLAADEFPVSTPATVYTVPASTTTRLTEIWVANNAAAARTPSIWIVNSGDTAGDDNKLVKEPLAVDGWLPIPLNTWLDTGDFIVVDADGADCAYRISGIEDA